MPDEAKPGDNPPQNPPANPPANPPTNPPANPPAQPTHPPTKPGPPPSPRGEQEEKPAAPAFMTADQVERLLAEREQKWEAERVPVIEERIRAPIRRDAKITSLREELKAAGKYLPADDDATDPVSPGDLAALAGLDDSTIVHTDSKSGKKFTQLDIEINRVRARLSKRTAKRTDSADILGTPPGDGASHADFYKNIREQKLAEEKAKTEHQTAGLARVFNMTR